MNKDKQSLFSGSFCFMILVSAGLILTWGIWKMPLGGINEGRRALTALEMVRSGNWLIPTMNGHIYIDKPPMLYWLMALSAKFFGNTAEWVLRLPSVIAALATCALLFRSLQKYINRDTAILAILILATSLSFTGHAHQAEIEMLQTFFCVAGNLFFLDYHFSGKKNLLYLSYSLIGFAILTKGPVALIFFVPPLLTFALWQPSRRILRGLCFWPGWLLMIGIGASWYVAIWFSEAGPLLRQVIEIDVVGKSLGGLSDSKPVYTYMVNLLGIFAPWTLLLLFRGKRCKKLFSSPTTIYFALQAIVPLLIMSLIASKHNKYILPLFPALAACLAIYLSDFYAWLTTRYSNKGKKYFAIFTVSLIVIYFVFYAAIEPRIYRYRHSAFEPLLAKLYEVEHLAPLYCLSEKKFLQLAFYYGQPIPETEIAEIEKMISAKRPFLLLVESRSWKLLPKQGLNLIAELKPYRKKSRAVKLLTNIDLKNYPKPYSVISYPEIPDVYSKLDKKLDEDSGLMFFDKSVWTFNDSGGEPEIYRINNHSGDIAQTVTLINGENHDWEDITQDDEYIYIADTGNNNRNRHKFKIYKIRKDEVGKKQHCKIRAEIINISYNDHRYDIINGSLENNNCESLISLGKSLILFTKTWGRTKMYKLPKIPGDYQLKKLDNFATDGLITGAALNLKTRELILLGFEQTPFMYIFAQFNGENFTARKIVRVNLTGMRGAQIEGIDWIDNDNILISTEMVANFAPQIYKINIRDILTNE